MPPIVLAVILAPFVGSFLGVVIRRWPAGRSIIRGRSRCESCDRPLGPAELVPVLSFLRQRGRCRWCGNAIDPDHLRIELAATVPPLILWIVAPPLSPAPAAAGAAAGWTLLALGFIDWRVGLLPDALTLPLAVAALGWTAWTDPPALADHAVAAIAGWALLAGLGALYRRVRGRAGLGGGDAKLFAAGGAMVGLEGLGPVLLIASLLALLQAYVRHGRRADGSTSVPFGPALAAAIFVTFAESLNP